MASRRRPILLCLMRCGETTWAADRRMQGSADLPLSDGGRTATAAAAAQLVAPELSTIYNPDDEAARDTAALYASALDVRRKVIPDLADPDLGLLEGLTVTVFAERFAKRYKQWQDDPISLSPPEGADFIDERSRILQSVAKLLRRTRAHEIGIVLHTLGFGFLRCWLTDRPTGELWASLESARHVERYALTRPMIEQLEEAAEAVSSGA